MGAPQETSDTTGASASHKGERIFLTAAEIGRELRITKSRVYELAAGGFLPTVRFGRRLLFPRLGLAELAAAAIERAKILVQSGAMGHHNTRDRSREPSAPERVGSGGRATTKHRKDRDDRKPAGGGPQTRGVSGRSRVSKPSRRKAKKGEGSIGRRKDGLWRGRLMVGRRGDGKPDVRYVYAKRRAECLRKLDALRGAAATSGREAATSLSFGDFLQRWLRDSVRLSVRPRTYESYAQQIRTHLLPALGHYRLATLPPVALESYYAAKLDAGLSSATVKYHHAIVHRALKQALRWELVARNIAGSVDPPRVRQDEMRFLTAEQVGMLLAAAHEHEDRLAMLWATAIYTGARQGELLAIRWSNIDFRARTLTISRALERVRDGVGVYAEPKTRSSRRTITLDEDMRLFLKTHRVRQEEEKRSLGGTYADEDLVFCTCSGRPLDRANVRRDFANALRRAKLPQIRFHDLRHTNATLLLTAGVNLKVAGARLGHSSVDSTLKYSHVTSGMDREAAQRVSRSIRRANLPVRLRLPGEGDQ